ncbi:Glutamyl-tRNA(Gln) amidotransferase subunit C [Emticicia aquatica]|jgi:aspartyl-tRNA(Asn)/glutamyl-tRNA(Gln) amidotransferase subunit C|uniref:Aspartyl/glutamyl-tRNA(Asn/Gln) amidotransferase subunit C n=1 Tax=Emticicia aquatica TaxID=1681835 RepID=A0ABN8EVX3_9BACT|nr:Asp-tRNA(Asn)/Glu-tRNA(Gln) amidotransferase subunit GatC [Emticicia aquatica]CAH0997187.1 Glutamyl-tRNA(Gln) amidotransferase subunit C [Emticicia aquatica]
MKIDQKTVKNIAHLARLELSEQEEVKMVEDLSKILNWMDQLKELDTTNVEPLTHMSEEVNVFREDVAKNELSREKGLKNAPSQNGEYFQVPKVIE